MSTTPRTRNCRSEKDSEALLAPTKRLCLPIPQADYETLLADPAAFRAHLDQQITAHPELFPRAIQQGYQLHDILPPSKKWSGLRLRRIKLLAPEAAGAVYRVAPSFVMPYMIGYTETVEKALFLRRFDVPFGGLTYIFGHDDLHWERMELRLGQNSLVGTTVKQADHLPPDLLADEKHTQWNDERAKPRMWPPIINPRPSIAMAGRARTWSGRLSSRPSPSFDASCTGFSKSKTAASGYTRTGT